MRSRNVLKYLRNFIIVFLSIAVIAFGKNIYSDLFNRYLYPIAERVVNYHIIIIVFLIFLAVMGLTFKGKKTYFAFWINVELILGYICFTSYYITDIISIKSCIGLAILALFSLAAALLMCVRIDVEDELNSAEGNGIYEPIKDFNDLYDCRVNQANNLINLIKNNTSSFGYSICISGEWGCGKTSFIYAILNKIRSEKNIIFQVIPSMR